MLDRTRTDLGHQHLRRRLSSPAETSADISALQAAHKAITTELAAFRLGLDRADPDGAVAYLNSRWEIPAAGRRFTQSIAGAWIALRYPWYLREIAAGHARVLALLYGAKEMSRRLSAIDSALLRELAAKIDAQLDAPGCATLLQTAARRSAGSRLAFDHNARGTSKERLLILADCLGELESLWSVAAATVEHGWTYPTPGQQLRIEGLTHPFLGRKAIANTLLLDADVRVCFLTGPNMAGKSTFLKAIAVAVILAQIGSGVPALAMELPPVRTVFSSVQIVDSIRTGESCYLAEVRRIRGLAVAIKEHRSAVAVIDEPFRGTNAHDAAEATLAVVMRLAAQKAVVTFVASHLSELGPLVAGDPRIRSLHFEADMSTDAPRFDFQLREGVSSQRLGMILLRQERVLEMLDQ